MTDFYWVRHGPTHEPNFCGWRDVPADLSDEDQIDRLHRFLPDDAVVVSSTLKRAIDTASSFQKGRTRLPHSDLIKEFHFGDWDGVGFAEVSERWPDLSRAYWETPGDVAAPNGESWNDCAARVNRAVDDLIVAHENKSIIAVAHYGTILTQVQRAINGDPSQAISFKIDNFSVTHLSVVNGSWMLHRVNHLP